MPDGPEIKLSVNTGGGDRAVNDLTTSFDKLKSGVQGADTELDGMVGQLKELATQIGVDKLAWDAFIAAIKDRAKDGQVAVRELRESLVDVSKMQMAGGGKAWKEGGEEDLRSIRKTIDLYEELDRKVKAYIASAETAAAAGRNINLGQWDVREHQLTSQYPLTEAQYGSVGNAGLGLVGAQIGHEASENRRRQEQEMERLFAERSRQVQAASKGVDSWRTGQQGTYDKSVTDRQVAAEREVNDAIKEGIRNRGIIEREVAEQRNRDLQESIRLERELMALEDRAALAGKRGTARVEVQRGQALRGVEDPEHIGRINNAFNTMAEAEEGGGGLSARMMRGVAQGAMGVGAGNYQMYYLMNSISNIGAGSAAAAGVAAAGVSVLALAAAQVAAANAASQHARELRNMSMELGTTAKNARELENVAKVTGIPMDSVVSGMRQLTIGVEESGGRGRGNAGVLRGMGVNPLTDTGGLKDTKQLLFEISDAIRGMNDIQARDILERLFGRGGRQLLPMLRQDIRGLSDSLNGLNDSLDDKRLENYAETMAKLSLAWDGLVARFAKPLVATVDFVTTSSSSQILAALLQGLINPAGSIVGPKPGDPGKIKNLSGIGWSATDYTDNDLKAGAAYRTAQMSQLDNTPEGITKLIQAAQTKYDSALQMLNAPGERGKAASITERTAVDSAGSELEALKAKQKAMTEIPAELLRLQKELNTEKEKELFGHEKITKALQDELALMHKQHRWSPANEAMAKSIYAQQGVNYDTELGRLQNQSNIGLARSGVTRQFSTNRSAAAAQYAVSRAGRSGIDPFGDINSEYDFAMGNANSAYSESMSGIADMRADLAKEDDPKKRISMQSSITTVSRDANKQFNDASRDAQKQFLIGLIDLTKQLTEEQSRYNSALGEMKIKGDESATALRESLIKRSLSDSMQLRRARGKGQGAGSQGILANNEFGFSVQMANMGISSAIGGAQESLYNESMRSSDVMSNPNLTPSGKSSEEIKHAQEVFAIKQKLQAELGKQMEAIDEAHIQLQMTSIEIQQQQNEQVKAFAGDLLGAYMQAMLHRQSGSFPVREALGQQFLGWGKKIGENVVGAGFGMLQGAGVGQHDIIPHLSHPVTDPKTGQTKEELTTLGKIFQGTPLGHRPAGQDKYVMSIDGTTQKILVIMQNLYGQDGNGGGSVPGIGTDNYDVSGSGGDLLPTSLNSPLGSGAEVGSIINSFRGSNGGSGAGIGGLAGMGARVAQMAGIGGLFSSGPTTLQPSWNSPLGSGVENGAIINTLPGMSNDTNSGDLTITGTDAQGLPTYNSSMSVSASSPGPVAMSPSSTFGAINTSTAGSTITSAAGDMQKAAKDVSAVASAASNIKNSDKNTGKSGAGAVSYDISQGLQAAATVANSIPGGQVVGGALEIGALVAAGVSAIFGDPRKTRELQMQYDAVQHQWTAPSAYNLVTSQNGMSVTGDSQGGQRQYNGPLLAFPNTSSYTSAYDYTVNRVGPQIAPPSGSAWPGGGPMSLPGGISPLPTTILSMYVNALDSKSIVDNADILATAVHTAINNGHPIRNGIQAAANPR